MEVFAFFSPTAKEVECLSREYNILSSIIEDGLDFNEHPRIEMVNNSLIMIFSIPLGSSDKAGAFSVSKAHHTAPFMVIFHKEDLILISPVDKESLRTVLGFKIEVEYYSAFNGSRSELLVKLISHISTAFLMELKYIHQTMLVLQETLKSKISNEDMLTLLHLQNCLTYYSFGLEGNELIIDRILKKEMSEGAKLKLNFSQENLDTLSDIFTDVKQGKSMTKIYTSIMKSLSSTYATITSNNVNNVMQILTALNFVVMIPAIITSAYGMNVSLPGQDHNSMFLFLCLMSICGAIASLYYLKKKGWF